jgi:hypothetical protein
MFVLCSPALLERFIELRSGAARQGERIVTGRRHATRRAL